MIVYVDSNILFNDPFLSSHRSKLLLDTLSLTTGKLKIPVVVYQESINNLVKNVLELEQSLKSNHAELSKNLDGTSLLNSVQIPSFNEQEIRRNFDQRYDDLVSSGVVEIIDHKSMNPSELLEELLHRALKGIKPFAPKKEEFKDSVIWMTIIHDIKTNGYSESIFLSNNTTDFYDESKLLLHENLLDDIPEGHSMKTFKSTNLFIASSEFLSQQSSLNSSINVTKELLPLSIKRIVSKVNKPYIYNKLTRDYHIEFKTALANIFDQIAYNFTKDFNRYFPLLKREFVLRELMEVNPNFFKDEMTIKIIDIINFEIITEQDFIIILCDLNIIPLWQMHEKMRMYEYYKSHFETEEAILNITLSFTIDQDELLEEFDVASCIPLSTISNLS